MPLAKASPKGSASVPVESWPVLVVNSTASSRWPLCLLNC
jgi:hypothetical protein